jgi:SAM-dependent methyltransferase
LVRRAASRGIQVCAAYGERLPFPHHTFDFVVLVTVGCFIEDLHVLFGEARRILRPNGRIIIGHIDKQSPLGRLYYSRKETDRFYRDMYFRPADEVIERQDRLSIVMAAAALWLSAQQNVYRR